MSACRRLSPVRIICMAFVLLGTFGTTTLLVRQLAGPSNGFAAGLLGILVFPIAASPIEWLVHRYVYHRRIIKWTQRIYMIHHRGHHQAIFPTWRFVTQSPVRRHPIWDSSISVLHTSSTRNLWIKFCHFSFYVSIAGLCIWLPGWLLTHSLAFLIGLVMSSVLVSDLLVRVHDAIHHPGQHYIVEAQPWFKFLEAHHYIHHVDTEANVNFLLPLADWLFGTLRRHLTIDELGRCGSLEEAKTSRLGMSEPAMQVARPRWRLNHPPPDLFSVSDVGTTTDLRRPQSKRRNAEAAFK